MVSRYEFRKGKIIFDCGNRDRFVVVAEFDSIEFGRRWNGDTIHLEGIEVSSRIRGLHLNRVRLVNGTGALSKVPGRGSMAETWAPFLSAEAMEKIRAFYASR